MRFFRVLRSHKMSRTYSDAVQALNGLQTNFSVIDAIRKAGGKANDLAIPEMLEWARRAGYSDPKVFDKLNAIHVTGTKGKGSTCAFVQSILLQYKGKLLDNGSTAAAVNKVGLYTSPHLKSVRERIRINGQPLSEDLFAKYFYEVWDTIESTTSDTETFPRMEAGEKPNYFRYLTLLSFHVFLREGVDAAIYEVGIGGEYDSTNILVNPYATGVSSLGLDHTHILGDTIEQIAWNKSGIFKKTAKAFSVDQPKAALDVLHERAEEKGTTLTVIPILPQIKQLNLGLAGEFQKTNASLASALTAEYLRRKGLKTISNVEGESGEELPELFVKGLEKAEWPGRCQTIKDELGKITWYLDGGHTTESVTETAKWFSTVADPDLPKVLVFNQQTRDANALITLLRNILSQSKVDFDHVIFTTNVTWSSGYAADLTSFNTNRDDVDELVVQKALAKTWESLDSKAKVHVVGNIERAVSIVRSVQTESQVQCLVSGSLLLVGGFLTVLEDPKPLTN